MDTPDSSYRQPCLFQATGLDTSHVPIIQDSLKANMADPDQSFISYPSYDSWTSTEETLQRAASTMQAKIQLETPKFVSSSIAAASPMETCGNLQPSFFTEGIGACIEGKQSSICTDPLVSADKRYDAEFERLRRSPPSCEGTDQYMRAMTLCPSLRGDDYWRWRPSSAAIFPTYHDCDTEMSLLQRALLTSEAGRDSETFRDLLEREAKENSGCVREVVSPFRENYRPHNFVSGGTLRPGYPANDSEARLVGKSQSMRAFCCSDEENDVLRRVLASMRKESGMHLDAQGTHGPIEAVDAYARAIYNGNRHLMSDTAGARTMSMRELGSCEHDLDGFAPMVMQGRSPLHPHSCSRYTSLPGTPLFSRGYGRQHGYGWPVRDCGWQEEIDDQLFQRKKFQGTATSENGWHMPCSSSSPAPCALDGRFGFLQQSSRLPNDAKGDPFQLGRSSPARQEMLLPQEVLPSLTPVPAELNYGQNAAQWRYGDSSVFASCYVPGSAAANLNSFRLPTKESRASPQPQGYSKTKIDFGGSFRGGDLQQGEERSRVLKPMSPAKAHSMRYSKISGSEFGLEKQAGDGSGAVLDGTRSQSMREEAGAATEECPMCGQKLWKAEKRVHSQHYRGLPLRLCPACHPRIRAPAAVSSLPGAASRNPGPVAPPSSSSSSSSSSSWSSSNRHRQQARAAAPPPVAPPSSSVSVSMLCKPSSAVSKMVTKKKSRLMEICRQLLGLSGKS